ncbi:MAG: MATE family efflux transporter [Lachnospiraceae bacterium]|nr:MATE family efflux transporter [Lachnospiraceae bacterium]
MDKLINTHKENPLGTKPVNKLLIQFAVPSMVAMLVSALYNIVDQFFIGRYVGELGNAATNIAFPLTTSCTAIALLCGIGGASAFNLAMGAGRKDEAGHYIGNAITTMVGAGVLLCIVVQLYLTPMLRFFGSPEEVLPFAEIYTGITALGFPLLIIGTGGGHLMRADGSPRMTMICNITGAVINTILDYLFVGVFGWKMAGAAWATVIGQFVAAMLVFNYFTRFKTVKLSMKHLMLRSRVIGKVLSLGTAPCTNQLAMMVVQIVLNNSLKYYGGMSSFGESIPIACVGIISKVCMVFFSFVIGISQGLQPIVSFNYGAENYGRVKKAYKLAMGASLVISMIAFVMFQVFPRQIIMLFGEGSEEYYQFAVRYFRVYMFFICLTFIQPITSNFFTAIGKPIKGVFLSLTRQIIFLIPLILILPRFMGLDGILYAGPIADFAAISTAAAMAVLEFRRKEYKNA